MATEKFILKEEDFLFLNEKLLEMGYRKMTKEDSWRVFSRLDLTPPRRVIGKETTYSYTNNGYTVVLHTSYLEKEKKWRDRSTDMGWNLITEGDEAKYFARPFKRTKDFVLRFLRYAWISKWKVDNRPLCPHCKAFMHLRRKMGSRQYFWGCFNYQKHPLGRSKFLSWDYQLPPKATEFLKIRRDYATKYNAKNKKLGKKVKPAAIIRKKWHIGKPENKI